MLKDKKIACHFIIILKYIYTGKYMNMNILNEIKEVNNSILMIGGEKEKEIKKEKKTVAGHF